MEKKCKKLLTLFPVHERRRKEDAEEIPFEEISPIPEMVAATSMKNQKGPGLYGIPAKLMKIAARGCQ